MRRISTSGKTRENCWLKSSMLSTDLTLKKGLDKGHGVCFLVTVQNVFSVKLNVSGVLYPIQLCSLIISGFSLLPCVYTNKFLCLLLMFRQWANIVCILFHLILYLSNYKIGICIIILVQSTFQPGSLHEVTIQRFVLTGKI